MDRITALLVDAIHAAPALLSVSPVYVIGVAVAWAFGVRGRMLPLIAAIPVLIGGGALLGQAFSVVGMPASPLAILVGMFVLSGLVAAGRLTLARRLPPENVPPDSALADKWVVIGAIGGAVLGLGAWLPGIADWSRPPQANDDIFHGYLVARLAEVTDLSAGAMAPTFIESDTPTSYYPYGMHLIMAMARAVSPGTVPAVMNGTWVLLLAVLLPFSTAVAARKVFHHHPRVALWAGLLTPATTGLYLLNGVMSYAMTLALIPAVLALVLCRIDRPRDVSVVPFTLILLGLFVSHPAAAFTAAIILSCVLLGFLATRRHDFRTTLLRVLPGAVCSLLLILPWYRAAGTTGVTGSTVAIAVMSPVAALSAALRLGTPWTPDQLLLAALLAVGVVAAVRWRAGVGVLVAYLMFVALYACVLAGYSPIAGRTGVWYGQWYRLFGAVSILVPVLAAAGTELVWRGVRRAAFPRAPQGRLIPIVAAVIAVGVGGVTGARYLLRNESIVSIAWGYDTVTEQDRAFFDQLARVVGKDEQVLNYWADGSTWMYALAGVRAAIPYHSTVQRSPWAGHVIDDPSALRVRADLCGILLRKNVRYAIAKSTLNDYSPNQFYADLAANRDLFRPLLRSSTSVLYSLNTPALEECAARG